LIWIRTSSTNIGAPFQRDDYGGMTCAEHPVAPLLMPGVLAVTKL
jgi:hypothetical protein